MTERLYYADPALREFAARIVAQRDGGRGPEVQLDRTAFYPTSGGQPHDTGTLAGVPVLDVWDDETGAVWHLLGRPPDGDEVNGVVDWDRRFDHMQQHTGQHLLSAAFVHLLRAGTLSFHLGTDDSHIDLDLPELSWEDAFRVEADVNRVIWENRPVEIQNVEEADIASVPLRRPPKVTGRIRVIWIRDYDAAACGGTHVPRTGGVGLLKITRIERYKGGTRVGFLCGGRALRDYQRVLRGVQAVSGDLSVHQDQLGDAVARLQTDIKDTRRALRAARDSLMAIEAERLWTAASEVDGTRRIAAHVPDGSFDDARTLAARLAARPRTVAILAVTDDTGVRLVCERGSDLPDVDAAALVTRAATRLGGRGGGTPELARGGAPACSTEEILAALREAMAP